jgi:putative membrane protein
MSETGSPSLLRSGREWALIILMLVFFAGHVGFHGTQLVTGTKLPFDQMTVFFSLFVITHACLMLGWRQALAFLLATALIGFTMEFIGVKTGAIFGRYYYTDVLGWKILGTVSWPIPLAYFMVLYPATMMANLLLHGTVVTEALPLKGSLFAALLAAMIMSAWDLSMDPYMAGEQNAWVWVDGGPYFNIPLRNFAGWVLTTFLAGFAYRLIEHRIKLNPMVHMKNWIIVLPLLCYGILILGDFALGYPEATKVIPPFVMGIALIASLLRMFQPAEAQGLAGGPD